MIERKTMKEARRKDTGVELGRIFGCLIVIGCHTYLPIVIHDNYDMSRTLVAMFCSDGVAIFWLILGFFPFQNRELFENAPTHSFTYCGTVVVSYSFSLLL